MGQQFKNQGAIRQSDNMQTSESSALVVKGAPLSFVFPMKPALVACVDRTLSAYKRLGEGAKHVSQACYGEVLRPVGLKLAPFFGGVNRWVLSPVSHVLVLAFICGVVKPLAWLANGSQSVAQCMWVGTKKVLAAILRSMVYQKLCKPFLVRPLAKVARLVNWVCVDFPAQVITWLFCAALAAVLRGGGRLSDAASWCIRGVRELSSSAVKQLFVLCQTYDVFAIVPTDHAAHTSRRMQKVPVVSPGRKLGGGSERRAVAEPRQGFPKI